MEDHAGEPRLPGAIVGRKTTQDQGGYQGNHDGEPPGARELPGETMTGGRPPQGPGETTGNRDGDHWGQGGWAIVVEDHRGQGGLGQPRQEDHPGRSGGGYQGNHLTRRTTGEPGGGMKAHA